MSLSNHLNRFWRLLGEGEHETLLSEIGEMGRIEPGSLGLEELLFVWGVALWRCGKVEEGAEKLREALKENPRSVTAHSRLANMLDEMEKFDEADRHYARASELAPNVSGVYVDWGIMLCRWGEHERAIEKFQEAERRLADDDNLHLYWGLSLESLGDLEEAQRRLETYVGRGRREPFAVARLGVVYSDLGMCQEAEVLLREAVQQEPDERDHLYNLAVCLKRLGRLDEALEAARSLVATGPGSADAWGLLGDIEFERGDMESARRRYLRSLELNPKESYTLSGLAWIALRLGDPAEAEQISRRALACDAGNASALDVIRSARPKAERLARFRVDICGECDDESRFLKSMDCLAVNEDEAVAHVKAIQEIFSSEVWWEIEEIEFIETIDDEHPGVCWISQYDVLEKPTT